MLHKPSSSKASKTELLLPTRLSKFTGSRMRVPKRGVANPAQMAGDEDGVGTENGGMWMQTSRAAQTQATPVSLSCRSEPVGPATRVPRHPQHCSPASLLSSHLHPSCCQGPGATHPLPKRTCPAAAQSVLPLAGRASKDVGCGWGYNQLLFLQGGISGHKDQGRRRCSWWPIASTGPAGPRAAPGLGETLRPSPRQVLPAPSCFPSIQGAGPPIGTPALAGFLAGP